MEIRTETYQVIYDPVTATISCHGGFRLYEGDNYIAIAKLLKEIADQKPPKIILDLRELRFLNSSGINMFFKFVIRVRDYKVSQLVIQGMKQIFWQNKLLANFQRLMPEVIVEME